MMHKLFSFVLVLVFLLVTLSVPINVLAQVDQPTEERFEAKIIKIIEEKEVELMEKKQLYQKLELLIIQGSLKDQKVTVENGNLLSANIQKFQIGDEVVVTKNLGMEGESVFFIADYIRRGALQWLFVIFVAVTVVIGRLRGLASLVSMVASFLIIFIFILPRILAGDDPVITTITGSLFIIPISFYFSHGFNRKTTIAVMGTFIALVITGVLASIFVEAARLTGFVSEEAGFLQATKQGVVNIKGLLLAGMIVGVLGVLDDVTVSQSAVVEELQKASNKLNAGELYKRAMSVGRDHIASMVNTLVLVYAGAAMPLMLLFVNNPHPFTEIINYEIIADEVIRTLVGSIGLVLAVPITTFIAVLACSTKQKPS